MTLRAVPPGVTTAYVLWLDIDLDAFMELVESLEMADHLVANSFDSVPADEINIRDHLQALCQAQVLVLPDIWWTSVVGHQVVQVAGWFGMSFMDYEGTPIETVSLAGVSGA